MVGVGVGVGAESSRMSGGRGRVDERCSSGVNPASSAPAPFLAVVDAAGVVGGIGAEHEVVVVVDVVVDGSLKGLRLWLRVGRAGQTA